MITSPQIELRAWMARPFNTRGLDSEVHGTAQLTRPTSKVDSVSNLGVLWPVNPYNLGRNIISQLGQSSTLDFKTLPRLKLPTFVDLPAFNLPDPGVGI
jgi:hypothetical protein